MELNKIYNESNIETMAKMPNDFIDLTVTSPPYDGLRTYNGYSFPFEDIAKELYRVTKQGGVVVWVVADATIEGSETGTSFKQALFFMQCGFNLHDTMIYKKTGVGSSGSNLAYPQAFEYMFVFSKGRPNTINHLKDIENKEYGQLKKYAKTKSDAVQKSQSEAPKTVAERAEEYETQKSTGSSTTEEPTQKEMLEALNSLNKMMGQLVSLQDTNNNIAEGMQRKISSSNRFTG